MGSKQNPRLGRYVVKTHHQETVLAYVPPPLPPNPSVRLETLQLLVEQASRSLGRLDGLAPILPNIPLFVYAYARKETVLASQIEGTQSSLSDLLLCENNEAPGLPLQDVQEVSDYVAAMNHGLERLRAGFPLSSRLIREIHEILLPKGRGSEKLPANPAAARTGSAAAAPVTLISYRHRQNSLLIA